MRLVWKLLRQHISAAQLSGFFFANIFGMFVVLMAYQFYNDVLPIFTAKDTFMKSDYIVVSKKIGNATTLTGNSNTFDGAEIDELSDQKFVRKLGSFVSADFRVNASIGISGHSILSSEIFIESIPDDFVDIPLDDWKYSAGEDIVPIIMPRSYINMYNFGFAQSRQLPKISEGLASVIDVRLTISGNDKRKELKGRVIGFSNKLNSILVPRAFVEWSNGIFSSSSNQPPTRLILDVADPTDKNITSYLESHGLEQDNGSLDTERTASFLRLLVTIVMAVGLLISILSFYILMLSIYLLVQKNASKLENLLLIGYSPAQVAMPYQMLTLLLNVAVFAISMTLLFFVRGYYIDIIYALFPQLPDSSLLPSCLVGLILLLAISFINVIVIRIKIQRIWYRKD
ncbi:MAG: ABC transporter permease [Prevotella sp.]|uniref:ABC transporter permease n=1 Tax=Prevotella sp. TaxID=59823 RepID=UPI002A2953CE|nr:ABC transporter permease [Prevotella sp.]MDD7318272.1 ABC transporter permease [Prevotellaceae bacterium]MDY4019724.1 ABC transporter permease [Prevotella sp.]